MMQQLILPVFIALVLASGHAHAADDVIRLLDHLQLPKAHLVGYSMGAIVAGKVAAAHPDRVLTIVYGGQAPVFTGKNKADAREIEVFAKAVEEGKGLCKNNFRFWRERHRAGG